MMHTRTHERTQSLTTRTRTSFGNVHRTDRSTYPNRILVRIFFSCDYRSRRRSVPSVVFLRNRWGAFFSPEFSVLFRSGLTELFSTSQTIQKFKHDNHRRRSNETHVQYWIHVRNVVEWRQFHRLRSIDTLHSSAHNLMFTVVNIEIVNCTIAASLPFNYYLMHMHIMSSHIWQVSCIRRCLWWMVRLGRRRIFVCCLDKNW